MLVFLIFYEVKAAPDNNKNSNNNARSEVLVSNAGNINVNANSNNSNNSIDPAKRQEEIKKKQEELSKIQKQVGTYEKRSNILDQKSDTIENMLSILDKEIQEIEEAIKKTQRDLGDSNKAVNEKEHQIVLEEFEIDGRRKILTEYVRELDLMDRKTFIEVILEKPTISEYLSEMENIAAFQERIREMIAELARKKAGLLKEKESLEEIKNEQLALNALQDEQRITLENDKEDREKLLAQTQTEQYKVQGAIDKGNEIVKKLASELAALQFTGEKIDISVALDEAKSVSQLTGVRAAFLLGVLKVESNMGNNVGGGRYKTDMNPAQWDKFKSICNELGLDPQDRPVSRKPCYRDSKGNCGGWGGAMGPAQFMPSTWLGYKEQVAKVTGHNPPNPWSLKDALTAMGLKLAKVDGVTGHERKAEHKAASIYLAGGNWEKFGWYGDRVLRYADAYEAKLNEK